MKCYKYISFDYFMTLVELDKPFTKIEQWIEETYRGVSDKLYRTFVREYARLYATKKYILGKKLLDDALSRVIAKYELDDRLLDFDQFIYYLFVESKAYEESGDVIQKLRTKYKVGLLTNADNDILLESIRKQKFEFDFIISSEDAGYNKPDIQFFNFACAELQCSKKEILHIGDSQVDDIFGGGRMGIETIWMNRDHEELKEKIIPPIATFSKLGDLIGELM